MRSFDINIMLTSSEDEEFGADASIAVKTTVDVTPEALDKLLRDLAIALYERVVEGTDMENLAETHLYLEDETGTLTEVDGDIDPDEPDDPGCEECGDGACVAYNKDVTGESHDVWLCGPCAEKLGYTPLDRTGAAPE